MSSLASIPSVERLLQRPEAENLIAGFGRSAVTEAIRRVLADLRSRLSAKGASQDVTEDLTENSIMEQVCIRLQEEVRPSLRSVFNLTGTVLHTNLGRAALPEEAIEAVALSARAASNLEYDLTNGRRGDRDDHVEKQLCQLTGAEAATVVNNNAAAVLLVLNTLASRKEVPASRGELIEIGGSFRMPDIMARSGCRLREVGTTNRTHLSDYEAAIGAKTGLVMKVHTSNYAIEGFTASVSEAELASLCRERDVPFAVDLGSGTLLDLGKFGLPHEPTAAESLKHGADIVTFSGDKLLGGPQAGIAALSVVLKLYSNPDRLRERLPTLRILSRPPEAIRSLAERVRLPTAAKLQDLASVEVVECDSQIGSGALPTRRIPSAGLAIRPSGGKKPSGTALEKLAAAFRNLPMPVIGRLQDGALVMDLRCLEDEPAFLAQLSHLVFK